MKNKIFLYLFVFTGLVSLYLFVSSGNMAQANNATIQKLGGEVQSLHDSLQDARLKVLEMQYFSLENNDDALAYYDHLEIKNPSAYVADKLLETNESKGDNPLVPYEGMQNDFKINKIKTVGNLSSFKFC